MPPKLAIVALVLVLMLRLALPQLLELLFVLDSCALSPSVLRRCSPLDRGAGAGSYAAPVLVDVELLGLVGRSTFMLRTLVAGW